MNTRINSVKTIFKIKLKETLLSPGFFISLSLGAAIITLLVYGFIKSVDSSGLDYMKHPIYYFIGRFISKGFGMNLLLNIFSEGPFLFSLCFAFIPVFLFTFINSIYRAGYEKKNGFHELLLYGPADYTVYFITVFLRDCVIYIISLIFFSIVIYISALNNNLVVGSSFLSFNFLIFFTATGFAAYNTLIFSITDNPGMGIFISIILYFIFTILILYNQIENIFLKVIMWLSPFYYMKMGFNELYMYNASVIILPFLLLIFLCFIILTGSHYLILRKGYRS